MGLSQLPSEVLLQIMNILIDPYQNADSKRSSQRANNFESLMYSNKRFQKLGETFSYQAFIQNSSNTLRKFIRALLSDPIRQRIVQTIDIKFIPEHSRSLSKLESLRRRAGFLNSESTYTQEQLDQIKPYLDSLNLPPKVNLKWLREIQDGSWAAEAALIIAILPNLREIRIRNCTKEFAENKSLINIALSTGRLRWPGKTLGKLSLRSEVQDGTTNSHDLRRMTLEDIVSDTLFNTSIHTLELLNMRKQTLVSGTRDQLAQLQQSEAVDTFWVQNTRVKFPFKGLHLRECNLPASTLQSLLLASPKLESLVYEHKLVQPEFKFTLEFFIKHIDHLKSTLRELEIYQPRRWETNETAVPEIQPACSLLTFEKLQNLSISANLVTSLIAPKDDQIFPSNNINFETARNENSASNFSDSLPPSITELKIVDCDLKEVSPPIFELLDHKFDFPKLKLIVLVARKTGHKETRPEDAGFTMDPTDSDSSEELSDTENEKDIEKTEFEERRRMESSVRNELEIAAWENDVKLEIIVGGRPSTV
ncbi:hypothetical protein GLAREA_09885 [Glarea lozoyensis ATCC 20868]|uniref:Uncharacterized protein n=1 Tax=Glarea lozoyensis (strain ATCC 20868 / MF5171) TaxID=1116229 RepID=S3CUW5_GLAL2|nr:uncharacterized protein GLAREA_09885 [Glarea lozoyensis ATCC 20868]EPE28764.1 hypothetical protein GLAREA_09885 [Glarea lozoyensis ATCC 20868]